MDLFTIGFTQKSAEEFFTALTDNGARVRRVIDIRRNNSSQLAGFTKGRDLEFFLKQFGISYEHETHLAPTKELLDGYKKKRITWEDYETQFLELMKQRKVEEKISPSIMYRACLLCSEPEPHKCHRRLVAEYFQSAWNFEIKIRHL